VSSCFANTLNTLGCRQRSYEATPEDIRRQSRKNSKNIQDYWDTCQNKSNSRSISASVGNRNEKLDYSIIEGFYEKRRDAIYVLFRLMGSPEEEYWEDEGEEYWDERRGRRRLGRRRRKKRREGRV
jgi:hypothetical protein